MSGQQLPASIQASLDGTKCDYRRLGKSGLKVSVPIVGCMSYGTKKWADWVLDEDESVSMLKAAYDRGLNTWDTANAYSAGWSEKVIAKALKQHKIPRDNVIILTKCFFATTQDPTINGFQQGQHLKLTKDYFNKRGLSRGAIFNQVNDSLARLETDYIDLLQIHRFDPETPVEETMEALHDLVKMGKVRYIGASSMWAYQFATMQHVAEKNGWTKFVSMQNHYNMLYREEEREMNKFCDETGVGLIPWGPLCRGHLARPPASYGSTSRSALEQQRGSDSGAHIDTDLKIIKRVEEIAEKRKWAMSEVALAWINKRVASPIIGMSSVARMEEALAARGKVLTEEEEKYLEELYVAKAIAGHV